MVGAKSGEDGSIKVESVIDEVEVLPKFSEQALRKSTTNGTNNKLLKYFLSNIIIPKNESNIVMKTNSEHLNLSVILRHFPVKYHSFQNQESVHVVPGYSRHQNPS